MKKTNALIASLLCGAAWTHSAQGQTVNYASSLSLTPLAFTSDGTVDNQVLTWTLGWFADGFTPTADNATSWYANWNPVSNTTYNHLRPFWAMSEDATPPASPDITSKKMWVFAYDSPAELGTPSGEALLYTQGKTFPPQGLADTFDIAYSGDVSDLPFTIVWGQVDRQINAAGGVVSGSGSVFSVQQADSVTDSPTFEAQSATWAAVPESSSALLSLLGTTLLLRRRR